MKFLLKITLPLMLGLAFATSSFAINLQDNSFCLTCGNAKLVGYTIEACCKGNDNLNWYSTINLSTENSPCIEEFQQIDNSFGRLICVYGYERPFNVWNGTKENIPKLCGPKVDITWGCKNLPTSYP